MTPQLLTLPVNSIEPNPDQPRTVFDDTSLAELAASIKEHGVRQPLTAYRVDNVYFLITGERRLRAAKIAGLLEVPCLIEDMPTRLENNLELALIENLQREDLSPADEARAYARLHDEFNLTDEQIAQRIGKARPTVTSTRHLTQLPAAVLDLVGDAPGRLALRYARAMIPLARAIDPSLLLDAATKIARRKEDDKRQTQSAEDILSDLVEKCGTHIPRRDESFDRKWPGKPIETSDAEGSLTVPACAECPSFVTAGEGWRRSDFCLNPRCLTAKLKLWGESELKRVGKKFNLAPPAEDETVAIVPLGYDNLERVRKMLDSPKSSTLRVIPRPDGDRRDGYHHAELTGSPAVYLATTDPAQFASKRAAEKIIPADETDAQRKKREQLEYDEYVARRDERGAARRAQADIDWLGPHVARLVAPQLTASGMTLEFLATVVDSALSFTEWSVMGKVEEAIDEQLKKAKGKERDALLRERIVVDCVGHALVSFDRSWHTDWPGALRDVEETITGRPEFYGGEGLGLRLPDGWNKPPIHKTPANCHICGKFAPGETLSQRDIAEFGWHNLRADGVVTCSDACRAKLKPAKKTATKKPAAKAKTVKKSKK